MSAGNEYRVFEVTADLNGIDPRYYEDLAVGAAAANRVVNHIIGVEGNYVDPVVATTLDEAVTELGKKYPGLVITFYRDSMLFTLSQPEQTISTTNAVASME